MFLHLTFDALCLAENTVFTTDQMGPRVNNRLEIVNFCVSFLFADVMSAAVHIMQAPHVI